MKWPEFYPENCPPEDAEPASGTFYRLVEYNPPQAKDFKSVFEENPEQFTHIPMVKRCGLSVHTDPRDSNQLKKRVRKFRNRQIAEGRLNSTLGMIQHTPSAEESHHTWWVPIGAEPWLVFNVIG